jgi:hypothetical protein
MRVKIGKDGKVKAPDNENVSQGDDEDANSQSEHQSHIGPSRTVVTVTADLKKLL